MTAEGKLTAHVIEYCNKKGIPLVTGVNGPRVAGWDSIPDVQMGTEKDDVYEKRITVEIKEKKEAALKDLQKEDYANCKHLACFYYVNGVAWGTHRSSFTKDIIERPLEDLLDYLYATIYLPANNPAVGNCVNKYFDLRQQFSKEKLFGVMVYSFTKGPAPLTPLSFSLQDFKTNYCDTIKSADDKLEVLHDITFGRTKEQIKQTREERHKLGQYITEFPHTIWVAEKVLEIFGQDKSKTIYEPCVGTGAIAVELLKLIVHKYGKRGGKRIVEEQLIFADIDDNMRATAHVNTYLTTEKLFGKGIHVHIKTNDLETDSFDLSKMIVYGNLPFNKGKDHLYLPRILKQLENGGMRKGVFIVSAQSINPNKVTAVKVLGEEFYGRIRDFQKGDLKTYGTATRFALYVRNGKTNLQIRTEGEFNSKRFVKLGNLVGDVKYHIDFAPTRGVRFKNKTPLYAEDYNPEHSVPFLCQSDLITNTTKYRVPSPGALIGTCEREMYERYKAEKGGYEPTSYTGLFLGYTDAGVHTKCKYVQEYFCMVSILFLLQGDKQLLGVVGLLLGSSLFQRCKYDYFKRKSDSANIQFTVTGLKALPIPKQIPQRLYDIGMEVIIRGNENEELRKEADEIIEKLSEGLEL